MLERFDRRVQAVGHVVLHGADAVHAGTRPHAAGDGFVIRERPAGRGIDAADGKVVHRAGGGRGDLVRQSLVQRAEQHVGDALRRFHIARRDAGRRLRVENASRPRDHVNGPQQAGVVGNVVFDQAAEAVHRRRRGDREVRVDAA